MKHKFSKRNTDVREEDKIRLLVNRDGTLEIMFNPSGQFVNNSCAEEKSGIFRGNMGRLLNKSSRLSNWEF